MQNTKLALLKKDILVSVAVGLAAWLAFPELKTEVQVPDYVQRLPLMLFICGFLASLFTQRLITRRTLPLLIYSILLTFALNSVLLVAALSSSAKGLVYLPIFFVMNIAGTGFFYQSTIPTLLGLWVFVSFVNWAFGKFILPS